MLLRVAIVLLLGLVGVGHAGAPAKKPAVAARGDTAQGQELHCQGTYRNKDTGAEEVLQVECDPESTQTRCSCDRSKIKCRTSQDATQGYELVAGTCKLVG